MVFNRLTFFLHCQPCEQAKLLTKKLVKVLMCDKCPYKTKNSVELKNHIRSNHGTTVFACDQCEYTTLIPKAGIYIVHSDHFPSPLFWG